MKRRGIDSIESWVVAIACSLSYMLYPLPIRLGGQLFVSILDRYQISRQAASFPFSLAFLVRSLAGPFAGYYGNKFGLQETTMVGNILCVIGVGGCYFAQDIITINIFFGFIYGLGVGITTSLSPEVINQHFKKHRAKSMGVVFGGSSLGVFIFSPLLENILHSYGLSGSFLIMSAILLHSVPFTMLLIKPKSEEVIIDKITFSSELRECVGSNLRSSEEKVNSTSLCKSECNISELSMKKVKESYVDIYAAKDNTHNCESENLEKVDRHNTPKQKMSYQLYATEDFSNQIHQYQAQLCSKSTDQSHVENDGLTNVIYKESSNNSKPKYHEEFHKCITQSGNPPSKIPITDVFLENKHLYELQVHQKSPAMLCKSNNSRDHIESHNQIDINSKQTNTTTTKNSSTSSSIKVLWRPLFLIVTYIQSSHFYLTYISWTILVDVVRDKKVSEHLEVYFVMALSLTDMIGRFALGCVTDNGYMTRANFSALCFTVMGLSSLIVTIVMGFTTTMVAICVLGLASGANTTALPGIVTQFFNEKQRPVAMASRLILFVPMSFTMSPLIGYFRGNLGSYDGLFYFLAVICIVTTTLLILLPKKWSV